MHEQGERPAADDWRASLARDVQLGSRTRPLDVWLAVGCAAVMVALTGWAAQVLLRGGLPLLADGQFGFVFGWALTVVGLVFASLAYAYGWIGVRLLARDPVGRWCGVALAGSVFASLLLQRDDGATGRVVTLVLAANALLLALTLGGIGLRKDQQRGAFPDLPLPVALALVVTRAQALAVGLFGASVLPAGRYEGDLYAWGVLLLGTAVALGVVAGRLARRDRRATYVVGGLAVVNGVGGLLANTSQVSLIGAGLCAAVLWALFVHPASRTFFADDAATATEPADDGSAGPSVPAQPTTTAAWAPAPEPAPAPAPPPPPAAAPQPPAPAAPLVAGVPTLLTQGPAPETAGAPVVPAQPGPADGPLAPALRLPGQPLLRITGPVVLGRRPTAPDDEPDAVLVPLVDDDGTLSRSHAVVRPGEVAGELRVEDLGSSNGTWVLEGDATAVRVRPGTPVRARVGSTLLLSGTTVEVVA